MSLIRINRKCEECNEDFIAKTISSIYCSKKCYKREYNRTKKSEQIKSPKIKIIPTIEEISTKSYLTIKEAALLYPISETTIRRAIKKDLIKAIRIGNKYVISKILLEESLNV